VRDCFVVGFNGPTYKQVAGLSWCLAQADNLCFDQVVVRVRRNASDNLAAATVPFTSRPLLSPTTNMSLESTPDQLNASSRHNDSLDWPVSELHPNSTLLPATLTDNVTNILDILEASTYRCCCRAVCTILTVVFFC